MVSRRQGNKRLNDGRIMNRKPVLLLSVCPSRRSCLARFVRYSASQYGNKLVAKKNFGGDA